VGGKGLLRAGFAALLNAAAWLGAPAFAADRHVENILVSRSRGEATVQIDFACPMRVQSDVAQDAGSVVEVHLRMLDDCRDGRRDSLASEVYRPASGSLADLDQIEYEFLGLGDSLVIARFDRPVDYRVAQRGDLRIVQLIVRAAAPATREDVVPPSITQSGPAPQPPAGRPPGRQAPQVTDAQRTPLAMHVRAPAASSDYVVNLRSTRDPIPPTLIQSVPVAPGQHAYVSDISVDGATWHRLRLGFFASETAAHAALQPITDRFPRAWIGRAEPAEVREASSGHAGAPAIGIDAAQPPALDADAPPGDGTSDAAGAATLSAEQVVALSDEARNATLDGDYRTAIRLYRQLLRSPGEHRAEARELLGVAYEKNGQADYAQAEYRTYLRQYPDGDGAPRVRQRLNGLITAAAAPREAPSREPDATAPHEPAAAHWDLNTGVAQYYRRDVRQLDENQDRLVTLSALSSDLDLSVTRSGGSLGVRSRITVNHLYDLLGANQNGPGDQSRLYYAYVDLDSVPQDWSLRFGRQSLHHFGVLGRFDGAHFTYEWAPSRRVHVTTGYPVESPRDPLTRNRHFNGIAVDFDELVGAWNLSAFLSRQTISGIDDRNAVGVELSYLDQNRSLTGIMDYDIDYGVLNSMLALGTWRLPNRMTVTALLDLRKSPVLTTRNALIGQPVAGMDELMLSFTEDEIRQLAVDRTADSATATIGIATPLGDRFQVNADVTVTRLDGTRASAGVPAIPDNGAQTYYSASLVGSGLFGGNDVSIFNLRYGESDAFATSQFTWDARFALGRRLRINPRLRLAVWQGSIDGRTRETLSPSLRLLLNMRNHYRLELELGRDELTRTQAGSEQVASGDYFNIGYRADF
jgi:tetratricopeptide (TPR) repeat protein